MVQHGSVLSAPTLRDRADNELVWHRAAVYAAEEIAKKFARGGREAAAVLRAYADEMERRSRPPEWAVRVAAGEDADRALKIVDHPYFTRPYSTSAAGPGDAARRWFARSVQMAMPQPAAAFAGPWRALALNVGSGEVWLVALHATATAGGTLEVDALGARDVQADPLDTIEQCVAVAGLRRWAIL